MKKICLILVVLLVSMTCLAEGNKDESNNVIIELKANKTEISMGDKLEIYYCLKNISNKTYRFSLLNNTLAGPFRVFDKNGKEFGWVSKIWFELKFRPDKEDLYTLKSNEEREFVFSMILENGFKTIGGKEYKGYFLSYKEWQQYIVLENEIEFYIEGKYNSFDSINRFVEKEYKFKDMFDKNINSKRIKIQIK